MSTATEQTGTTLPAPGVWEIDPAHTTVGFVARHLMVAKVRGRFTGVTGAITVAERPEDSSVEVTIDAATIDTREEARDNHLRSPDFLDVENHPTITFRSTRVRHVEGHRWAVDGELTIKGVTRPVTLDVTYEGVVRDPWGGERVGFSATTEIDRDDWGVSWNVALEAGGFLVGKKVMIEIEVEAVRKG